ncbi:hypothetical protein FCE95_08785 [Luteimonas gilva]|uniref:Discoidin domain-containing protein n=1 Tax=Luteimonas gilva TaxID=2572684 RepID=A0A4U5JN73_9GAMM|nr:hypothetical protein [Luteimonas gilva]TKR30226.1 hypothetical protein FCE95_08785 [Luteimonas gilva]
MKGALACLLALWIGNAAAVGPADFQGIANHNASVAIHVSENTDSQWGAIVDSANRPDPYLSTLQGPGGWKYWHIYGFLMEQLRSDGTAFDVVFDSDIANGALFVSQADVGADIAAGRVPRHRGEPKYAALFSLSNICSSDAVVAAIDGFVLGGGRAIVGGASYIKAGNCSEWVTPPFSIASVAAPRTLVTAKNSFSSAFPAIATVDPTHQNLWLNQIDDVLPAWLTYRFETGTAAMPIVTQVALQHSTYQDRGFGYTYLIKDFDVQLSANESCADGTFVTVASDVGSQLSGAYQIVSFPAQEARCVRVRITSSYENTPYPGYDTSNWVGLSGFQAFNHYGNALIPNTYAAGPIWRAMGLSATEIDGCFDHIRREDASARDPLLQHFVEDDEARGYRLGRSQTSPGYEQTHHWGQKVALDASAPDGSARVLAVDDPITLDAGCPTADPAKPIFATKQRSRGKYIYSASINSLAGWSMHSSAAYVYGVYRNAINEAHQNRGIPNLRIGAWPWPYKAGFMTRHDHFPHRGFDPASPADDDLVARIERYSDGLAGGNTLRDFPVKGSYFLLNEWSPDGSRIGLPIGSSPCTLSAANDCDAQVAASIGSLLQLGAEIGNHQYVPGQGLTEFTGELARLDAYVGASVNPRIYVSHGAYSHFDADQPDLVGIQTLAQNGVVAKGEDSHGPHPHYALRFSDPAIIVYNDAARHGIVDIPATGLSTRPSLDQWPQRYGLISHEITANPPACNQDSLPARPCMERAADLMYALGGVINLYDHIGDHSPSFSNDGKPDAQEFDAYIRYAQGLPYVLTTSTRGITAWWNDRNDVRASLSRTGATAYRIDLTGNSTLPVSVNLDIPTSAQLQSVTVNGTSRSQCPALGSGNALKSWLTANPHTQCYVREGGALRIGTQAPATVSVAWL